MRSKPHLVKACYLALARLLDVKFCVQRSVSCSFVGTAYAIVQTEPFVI